MFFSGKPFQPSLVLGVRTGAYPRVDHLKGAFKFSCLTNIHDKLERLPLAGLSSLV
jgi:hypothetical protein